MIFTERLLCSRLNLLLLLIKIVLHIFFIVKNKFFWTVYINMCWVG